MSLDRATRPGAQNIVNPLNLGYLRFVCTLHRRVLQLTLHTDFTFTIPILVIGKWLDSYVVSNAAASLLFYFVYLYLCSRANRHPMMQQWFARKKIKRRK